MSEREDRGDLLDYWWGKIAVALTIAPVIWFVHWQLHGRRPSDDAWVYNKMGVWGTTVSLITLCLLLLGLGIRQRVVGKRLD